MDRTILLLGQEKLGKRSLSKIISACHLPESMLVNHSLIKGAKDAITDPNIWLIIINATDTRKIKKFLQSLQGQNALVPIIVIQKVDQADLEVLISLGVCDVIDPEIITETMLMQAILSAIERKRIETDLISRDAIMEAVNHAAEVFLLHLDWETRINEVLKHFGQASKADRVCIYRYKLNGDEKTIPVLQAGWCSREQVKTDLVYEDDQCAQQGYLSDRWLEIIDRGEIIYGRTLDFSREDQSALLKKQIQSIIIIPILSDHIVWGFITLEHCRREKQWTEQEVDALRTAARIFGAGISRVDAETRLTHLATHDFLTNLPNRMLLEDRFEQAVARAERSKKKFGVVALDLDKFKQINDTYGHPFGDQVLIEIAWRLSEAIRTSDTCARVGGDEFTVLAEGINGKRDLMRVMEKLSQALSEPIRIDTKVVNVTASLGASLFPNHGKEIEELMKAADIALYQAKDKYAGYRIYASEKQISLIEE